MTYRSFKPWVEQLERRLMLTIVTDVYSIPDALDPSLLQSAEIWHGVANSYALDVSVWTEHNEIGHSLVVEVKVLDQPRIIGVVGGSSAWTQSDGTVRLHEPEDAQSIDITISDNQGTPTRLVRVEFDTDRHIVRQTRLDHLGGEPSGEDPIIVLDQSIASHSGMADHVLTLPSNFQQPTTTAVNSVPMSNDRMVDQVMAQHYGMPATAMNQVVTPAMQHMSTEMFTTSSRHVPEMSRPSVSNREVVTELDSDKDMEAMSNEFVPEFLNEQIYASASDEQLESILEGWVGSMDAEVDDPTLSHEGMPEEIVVSSPSIHVLPVSDASTTDLILAIAEPSPSASEVPSPDQTQGSRLPVIVGMTLAIASATAAWFFERNASKHFAVLQTHSS